MAGMTKQEAIAYFGTQTKLADALGLKQPTIAGWVEVPLEHQFYLEIITTGDLIADPHPAERSRA